MTDHTTIQITTEQAKQLRELRQYEDDPYKSVIAELLDDSDTDLKEVQDAVIAIEDRIGRIEQAIDNRSDY